MQTLPIAKHHIIMMINGVLTAAGKPLHHLPAGPFRDCGAKEKMLLIQFPGAEARRKQIEAAMAQAVAAGGNRQSLHGLFEAVGVIFLTLSVGRSEFYEVILDSFIEAVQTGDAGLIKKLHETLQVVQLPDAEILGQLIIRIEHFFEMKEREPEVAELLARALLLLKA